MTLLNNLQEMQIRLGQPTQNLVNSSRKLMVFEKEDSYCII